MPSTLSYLANAHFIEKTAATKWRSTRAAPGYGIITPLGGALASVQAGWNQGF